MQCEVLPKATQRVGSIAWVKTAGSTPGRRIGQGSIILCTEAWGPNQIELLSCLRIMDCSQRQLGRLQGDEMDCLNGSGIAAAGTLLSTLF